MWVWVWVHQAIHGMRNVCIGRFTGYPVWWFASGPWAKREWVSRGRAWPDSSSGGWMHPHNGLFGSMLGALGRVDRGEGRGAEGLGQVKRAFHFVYRGCLATTHLSRGLRNQPSQVSPDSARYDADQQPHFKRRIPRVTAPNAFVCNGNRTRDTLSSTNHPDKI